MNSGRSLFTQVMEYLPRHEFRECVGRYGGDHKVRKLTCRDQFLPMSFAQLTYRESLRDIEICLQANRSRLYHMGLRCVPHRSTLADANEDRDWRIYADLAQVLIQTAKRLYRHTDIGLTLEGEIYALDSTTIDFCLSLFPWANFRQHKAAVKIQLWIVICTYLLVAILKKELDLPHSLYSILQFLSVSIFEKTPISQAFSSELYIDEAGHDYNQLLLFNV
jgi:hypothetical protein